MLSKEFYALKEKRSHMTPGPGFAARGRVIPQDVTFVEDTIAGRHIIRAFPSYYPDDKLILHFHGGGMVGGSAEEKKFFYGEIARRCKIKVVSGDYRLLPDTYPAASDDCLAIYKGLLAEGYAAENIVLLGESAGGYQVMSLTQRCRVEDVPLPIGLAALSSTMLNGELSGPMKEYAGGVCSSDPVVNPYHGDYSGVQHFFAQVGTDESMVGDAAFLLDCANKFYERVRQTTDFEYYVGEGLGHVYSEDFSLYPEADEGFEQLLAFIRRTLLHKQ